MPKEIIQPGEIHHVESNYDDADGNILKETYFSPEYVIEHTVVPEPGNCPDAVVAIGPGRTASTAFLGLLMSQAEVHTGYYQPWKTIIRHGLEYGEFVIPGQDQGAEMICAKETLGPFNKAEEFDPVDLLMQAGFPQEKIKAVVLLRDPLATYKSNLKFQGGIDPEILISNIKYTCMLNDKYLALGIPVTALAYELCALGEKPIAAMLSNLGIAYEGVEFDSQALNKASEGGKFVPGESEHPAEWKQIIAPTFSRGCFEFTNNGLPEPEDFTGFKHMPGAQETATEELVKRAEKIKRETNGLYLDFLGHSALQLGVEEDMINFAKVK